MTSKCNRPGRLPVTLGKDTAKGYHYPIVVGNSPNQPIRLTNEQLRHIHQRHPEMVGLEWAIRETMDSPEVVLASVRDPERVREYYRWFPETPEGSKFVRVVIGFEQAGAFVITAHLARRIPRRGG